MLGLITLTFSLVTNAQPVTTIYLPHGVLAQPTKDGVAGAFPDIPREAARRIGQPVTLKAQVWKRSQDLAKREPGVAAAPLTRIPPRESQY